MKIMDFDGDGEEELLVIYLNNKEEQDGEYIKMEFTSGCMKVKKMKLS